jgi:CHAT domain-containing protein/Tfp pilus assembly protein PilF
MTHILLRNGVRPLLRMAVSAAALGVLCLMPSPVLAQKMSAHEEALVVQTFEITGQARDLYAIGAFARAERLFRDVVDLQRASPFDAPLSLATALHNLAATLAEVGRLAEAEPLAQEALQLREGNGAVATARVSSLQLLSTIQNDLGHYAQARQLAARAVELGLGLELGLGGQGVDPANLIRTIAALAYLTAREGDLEGGIALINQVVPMLADLPPADVARVINTVGRLTSMSGDPATAETYYREAVARSARLPVSADWTAADHATVLNNLAALLLQQGRLDEAEVLFTQANQTLLASGFARTPLRATLLDGLGEVARARQFYTEAFAHQSEALSLRLASLPDTHPAVGASLSNMGLTLLFDGQAEAAVKALQKAVEIQTANGDTLREARARINLSGALAVLGRGSEAVVLAAQASKSLERRLPKGHPKHTAAQFNVAWLALAAGQPDQAMTQARLAMASYRDSARRLGADNTVGEGQLRSDRRQVLAMVAALWDSRGALGGQTGLQEAFEAAQWAQSSAAGQSARRVAARFAAGEGEIAELARRKQDLVNQWRALDQRYLAQVAVARAETAQENGLVTLAADLTRHIDRLDAEILTRFPAYAGLTQPGAVSVAQVQAMLTPSEAVLLPITTPDETYVFAITSDAAVWARSPLTEVTLDSAVRRLRADLDGSGVVRAGVALTQSTLRTGPKLDRTAAHDLYQQLFAPVADLLNTRQTLFVVQEGALAGLPLSLLVASAPKGEDSDPEALRATDWVMRHFAISTLPSVSSLVTQRRYRNPVQPSEAFAGFGDPRFQGTQIASATPPQSVAAYFTRGLADPVALNALPPLPGTRREVLALARALEAPDTAIRLGLEATETAVKSSDLLRHASIVAFATHGLVAGDISGLAEPALAFTPPAVASATDDGLLTASEVTGLSLSADWVILSACNTAAPDGSVGGEGLSGLANAFFYAGARSLLVSHWPVRDDAAAWLTQHAV